MSGIAGIAVRRGVPITPGDYAAIRGMTAALSQHGPHSANSHRDGSCVIAVSRGAAVDPDNGHQPFYNAEDTVHAVIDGAIFNHLQLRARVRAGYQWQGRSDCEVALGLYETSGITGLEALRGTYAAAIIDRRERALYLVRDRLGAKPLCYVHDGERIVFGSQIKALIADPRGCQLPAGHILRFDLDTGSIRLLGDALKAA